MSHQVVWHVGVTMSVGWWLNAAIYLMLRWDMNQGKLNDASQIKGHV